MRVSLLTLFVLITNSLIAQIPLLDALTHPKFQNPVPVPTKIQLSTTQTNVFEMAQISQSLGLVNSLNNPLKTTVWGYGPKGSATYPGPTLLANSTIPVNVEWINNLLSPHLLPIDHTYHMAMPTQGIPAVVHLHGGHSESASDGGPEAWYTPFYAEKGLNWKKSVYTYDNSQEGATLWYHDHTLGITRLNVYAGLAWFYLLNDANDQAISLPRGKYDRELVIQDRMFTNTGQLYYPSNVPPGTTATAPSGQPEFFGTFILVNGMVWPFMNVEPRKYRLRLLNGSDSRVYTFALSNKASFMLIGTDNGKLNNPQVKTKLDLAPGERAEIIVDFTNFTGKTITLLNNGPDGPFGNPKSPASNPATTGHVMQFRVIQPLDRTIVEPIISNTTNLRPINGTITPLGASAKIRKLGLFEGTDQFGRILPMLGIVDATNPNNGSLLWHNSETETINLNDTETWEIYNTTMDAHPIHLHLVSFQVLSKQTFKGKLSTKPIVLHNGGIGTGIIVSKINLTGKPKTFLPTDNGWKDTYIIQSGEVVQLKAKFDRAGEYLWHCHILSHEDHDMMRKFTVNAPLAKLLANKIFTIDALPEYNRSKIEWVNNTGQNNDYFSVQKFNPNTNDFEELKIVNSTSKDNDLQYFTEYDNAPNEGDNYYRIKLVFNDGSSVFSEVKKVTFGSLSEISIFPNPAESELNIDLNVANNKPAHIFLYNQLGQTVQIKHFDKIGDALVKVDVSQLVSGQYTLRITSPGKKDFVKNINITH